MEILIKPLDTCGDPFTLKSKTELTIEKVYDSLIFMSIEEFYSDIWELLLQGITVYKPKKALCTFSPFFG
mgnify:CR=1 FL=1